MADFTPVDDSSQRIKSSKSAPAGDSETDDDALSGGKTNDGTLTKGRRRISKRRAKSKPEPPSAPPPVVGEGNMIAGLRKIFP